MRTCVVIPAYNEARRIGEVIPQVLDLGFEIIVVDDGSRDDTPEIAKNFPIIIVRHFLNQGQGAALKTGTELAIKLGFDFIVHFDADGQHEARNIAELVEVLHDYEVALGSRFLCVESEIPKKKRMILMLAKIFSQWLLQLEFSDPQSGLRAFRASAADRLDWQKNDFQHCTEILNLIIRNELRYKEIPVKINYDDYSTSKEVKPKISMGWKLIINKFID
ncbi:glycosyltransferase family 2 protein [Patescibacteria group bacterium]|nr:glycosyltransferase family 2 protein [Patescibacteria group bacterium]